LKKGNHNKGGKKLTAKSLQMELLQYLSANPKKKFAARQLIFILKIDNNIDSVSHALEQLAINGSVQQDRELRFGIASARPAHEREMPVETLPEADPLQPKDRKTKTMKPNTFEKPPKKGEINKNSKISSAPPKPGKIIEGRVDMTRSGAAYIVSDLIESDVYVSPRDTGTALNGDTVRVELFPHRPARRGQPERKPEGRIVGVVKRTHEFFLGTLHKSKKYGLVVPDNLNMQFDIHVPLDACGEAKDGDKVVVRITDWPDEKRRAPVGKVTQVLGVVGGNDFEMKKILINAGFELSHSEEAMQEAERIPMTISPLEIETRRDFRDVLTFTIDPEDAKDFDDALSLRTLENGHLEVGVHIADVTHYLKPDSPMDIEAYRRSTSVYLVDRCNPMLPEKLSNNLCSLVPHQDRLTFSAVFTFDQKDKIASRWFGKTVIHSAKRFTYEEAQTVLDNNPAPSVAELDIFPQLNDALHTLQRLAQKMRKERERNGAIGFETDEVRFRLMEDGMPIEAYVKERKDAHLLIEDFMLLANKEVALYIEHLAEGKQEIPFIYRVHDLPDQERVAEFARFAAELGHPLHVDTPKQIAAAYNSLMKAARTNERLKILEPLAIRTMAKAIYSTKNIGHYGLGFTHYSHFTSPIRRYSDVLAHRLLQANLNGNIYRMEKDKLDMKCKHVSTQEKKAAEAERESIKYTQALLMRKHIGDTFDGIISGMIDRGFFVEIPTTLTEGMVDFKYLDDTYVVQPGNVKAQGRRYGTIYKIGDRIKVRIAGVDVGKRQIDMELVEA
jgi:ribonuclease R